MGNRNHFIEKLKKRWGIKSAYQVIVILIVFACTGFSVLYVEDLLLKYLHISKSNSWWAAVLIFVFLTLPIYNILLLIYGFIFGQFKFFWNFEKKFFGRILNPRKKSD